MVTLTPGTRLGPYEIESLIGAGSMGAVYKAKDARLNRSVAIKRVTAQRPERFETEARAIAALNHPHVCQIYDIGPDYLVLEYLHGEPLRGPVTAGEARNLAIQMADALRAAHERGILHRDLKPANVMVVRRDGMPNVKLLDFGIARLAEADVDATRTVAGDPIGTPPYMSPEQAQGQPVDERSDVFSLGAVLYELLFGRRAFPGDSVAQVLSAVLRDHPPPLDARGGLPSIVTRCLAKDPALRYQSMHELKQALEDVTLEGSGPQASIAVLPFANLSADRENEYFGDGLAEEIINALVQVDGLKVIARTSAFFFKGKNEDVRQIAQALGVTNVLEGSVRRSGERLRVTAQLIAAADGAHLWSERFDRPMTDVFAMQDEIATVIATALRGKLRGSVATPRSYTPKIDAYESFLKGRAHLVHFTPEAWKRAQAHFEQAIALDSSYAEPHAELALGHFISGMHGMRPMRDVAAVVRLEVNRALELDPSDQRPRFLLGAVAVAHDYDWPSAAAHFDASMSGTHVPAHARWIYASLYLSALGRFDESANEMARAVEQDPLNATFLGIWSAHLVNAGRFDQAIDVARRSVTLEPHDFVPYHVLGEALWDASRSNEALAAFEHAHALAPWFAITSGRLAAVLRTLGQNARADAVIDAMGPNPRPLFGMAVYHLLTSNPDAAADCYERMIEERDPFALVYARSPLTRPLREHRHWPRLAGLMRLPDAFT